MKVFFQRFIHSPVNSTFHVVGRHSQYQVALGKGRLLKGHAMDIDELAYRFVDRGSMTPMPQAPPPTSNYVMRRKYITVLATRVHGCVVASSCWMDKTSTGSLRRKPSLNRIRDNTSTRSTFIHIFDDQA
eukprot:m.91680 g.91680  ORF g.91680 m.91680 type:complete len:130 (-) comp14640_c0_seq8:337-726(-)